MDQKPLIVFRNIFIAVFVLGLAVTILSHTHTVSVFPMQIVKIAPLLTLFQFYLFTVALAGFLFGVMVENRGEISLDAWIMLVVIIVLAWFLGMILVSKLIFMPAFSVFMSVFSVLGVGFWSAVITAILITVMIFLPLEDFLG